MKQEDLEWMIEQLEYCEERAEDINDTIYDIRKFVNKELKKEKLK